MTFEHLNLHPQILKALAKAGYSEPTAIQAKAIPKIIRGFDLRASAQTGTGKTAAFLLPALDRLAVASKKSGKGPRVLILVPTRELGLQIALQAEKYGCYLERVKSLCIGGGVPVGLHLRKLLRPYDLLIATPGRLIDVMQRGKIDFSRLEMLVLDEADRMLDMGFVDAVEKIVAATPKTRQTLLFSATLQGSVSKLSEKMLNKPMEIVVHAERTNRENIQQHLHYVDDIAHKNRLLEHFLNEEKVTSTIVFTSTKRHAAQLVEELMEKGYSTAALHGDMNQRQRTRTIAELRSGKISVLVATDVAARGIDIHSISHVINFDLPYCVEDYVHRIGRTGRAGAKGVALSFVGKRDISLVGKIEKFTGQSIDVLEIPGFEPRKQGKERPALAQRPRKRGKAPFAKRASANQRRQRTPQSKRSSKGGW